MHIHFDSHEAAVASLKAKGWKLIKNGNWVSRDGDCAACVNSPIPGTSVVPVFYWEVPQAAA